MKCKWCNGFIDKTDEHYNFTIHKLNKDIISGDFCKLCTDGLKRTHCPWFEEDVECFAVRFRVKRPTETSLIPCFTFRLPKEMMSIIIEYYASEYDYVMINAVNPDVVNQLLATLYRSTEASMTEWMPVGSPHDFETMVFEDSNVDRRLTKIMKPLEFYDALRNRLSGHWTEERFEFPQWNPFENDANIKRQLEKSIQDLEEKRARKRKKWEYLIESLDENLEKKRKQLAAFQENDMNRKFFKWQHGLQ